MAKKIKIESQYAAFLRANPLYAGIIRHYGPDEIDYARAHIDRLKEIAAMSVQAVSSIRDMVRPHEPVMKFSYRRISLNPESQGGVRKTRTKGTRGF